MDKYIKLKLVFVAIAFILFVVGVTCLVLSFIKPGKIYLLLALGFTAFANFVIVFANVVIRPKNKKD